MISSLLRDLDDFNFTSRIGFIGTRKISAERALEVADNATKALMSGHRLISGGAQGVDSVAESVFRQGNGAYSIFISQTAEQLNQSARDYFYGVAQICHPSWNSVVAKGPYVVNLMVRNVLIVYHSDIVLAWPSPNRTGGTEHGITVAKHLGKRLEIFCE